MSATLQGAIIGRYSGATVAAAFTNPQHLDLIQVIHPNKGNILYNVDYLGVKHSPALNPTKQALLGIFSGVTFAAAFSNPSHLDLIQIYQPNDGSIVYYLDYLGANH